MLLVIEPGGLPVCRGVAASTVGLGFLCCLKLSVMGVGMTGTAELCCPPEGDQPFATGNLRFVTTGTQGRAVFTRQRVAGGAVVKRSGLFPVPGCVTGLATGLLHRRGSVRILVALEAPQRGEVELRLFRFRRALVALGAGHCRVGARQRHPCLQVRGCVEEVLLPACHHVAMLAAVLVRSRGELAEMPVLVAVLAGIHGWVVVGIGAHSGVALHARDLFVRTHQWIVGRRMIFDCEPGRLPGSFRVTAGALTAFPGGKLPLVAILVAIETACVRDRSPEVLGPVALLAVDQGMPAFERELGF